MRREGLLNLFHVVQEFVFYNLKPIKVSKIVCDIGHGVLTKRQMRQCTR